MRGRAYSYMDNRRKVRMISINGVKKDLRDVAEELGIPRATLLRRALADERDEQLLRPPSRFHMPPPWATVDLPYEEDEVAQTLVTYAKRRGGMSLQEVAIATGVTRQRIAELEHRLYRELRVNRLARRAREYAEMLGELREKTQVMYPAQPPGAMTSSVAKVERRRAARRELIRLRAEMRVFCETTLTDDERTDTVFTPEQSGLIQRPENDQGEQRKEQVA